MIVVLADTTREFATMQRLIDGCRHRGDDDLRRLLADVRIVSIHPQSSAALTGHAAPAAGLTDNGLMTRSEAATVLTCSTSTVDRLAAAGRIRKCDGRITTTSIAAYLNGETA